MSDNNLKETIKNNQKEIIADKERFYDKMIDSMHLTTRKMDLIIIGLLVLIVVVFLIGLKTR